MWRRAGAWAVVTVAAVVRLASPGAHFQLGQLIPPDADSAYHLRRARSLFEDPVGLPSVFDPFLGYPEGATVPWAPGWDAWLALCGWVFGGFSSEGLGFEVGVALAPLLVGIMTVALAMRFADRLFGPWAGLGAGLFTALVPQHVAATQFARCDHNAAEGFFLLLLVAEASRARVRPWVFGAGIAGVCLAWVGGLMYAGLGMGAALLGALLMPRETGLQAGWDAVWGMVLGALILLPLAGAWGALAGTPFTYAYLSAFQPAMLGLLAFGAAVLMGLRFYPAQRRSVGALGLVGLGACGVGLAPVVVRGFREWLTTQDPWLDTVTEMQPLLTASDWTTPLLMLSWALPLLPFALWRVRRQAPLVMATSGCLLLVLLQNRFGWALAPLMGVTLAGAVASLRPRLTPVVLVLVNLHSLAELEASWILPKTQVNREPWSFEAYQWIAENTPPVSAESPEYGIAGRWDHGHWLSTVAKRPEHIGHFGSYTNGVERYLETEAMFSSQEGLLQLMDRDGLRYLVLEAAEVLDTPMEPLAFAGAHGGEHVEGLRAVFAASTAHPFLPTTTPAAWVYERVEGALVQADEVAVALKIRDQLVVWRAEGPEVRVPYWCGDDSGVIETAPFFEVRVDGQWLPLELSEEEVRTGQRR